MPASSRPFSALTYRVLGAALLDRGTYEGIEHDRTATVQAAIVVVASSLAAGIGASGGHRPQLAVLLAVAGLALVTWLAWALLILQIGGRYLPERQTRVDFGELVRTIGFAASPGLVQVFALMPNIAAPVFIVSWLWMLAAMTVAVRQALDFRSIGRALAVCGAAFALVLALAILIAVFFGQAAARATSADYDAARSVPACQSLTTSNV